MHRSFFIVAAGLGLFLGGCTTAKKEPLVLTAPKEKVASPVVREVIPAPEAPVAASKPSIFPLTSSPTPLYVCVNDTNVPPLNVSITFVPRVEKVCRRHPEMGPCQYEREACRRSGGRVFTADGTEITMQTESEYDQHVMRVRFRAN